MSAVFRPLSTSFNPKQHQLRSPHSRPLLTIDAFFREIVRRVYDRWRTIPEISWLPDQDIETIYKSVIIRRGEVEIWCLLTLPEYMTKKVRLQLSYKDFDFTIRLKSEKTVKRINVRDDPHRPGHRVCRWPKPLNPRTMVINTDASKGEKAGIGWIFRDSVGHPLKAYAALCEKMEVYILEVLAVQRAVAKAAKDGKEFVVIETDATIAVSLINNIAASYSNLVDSCRIDYENYLEPSTRQGKFRGGSPRKDQGLEQFISSVVKRHEWWTKDKEYKSMDFLVMTLVDLVCSLESFKEWGCRHIFREANGAADFLSRLAVKGEILDVEPSDYPSLVETIKADADDGKWYEREKATPFSSYIDKSTRWMLRIIVSY